MIKLLIFSGEKKSINLKPMIYPSVNSNVFVAKVYAVNTCTLVTYADSMNSRACARSSLSLDKAFRTELCIRASCGYV